MGENEIVVGWGAAYDLGISTMDFKSCLCMFLRQERSGFF